ncbi:MAG: hypothetical protein ABSH53_13680 [Holophaga sp.]
MLFGLIRGHLFSERAIPAGVSAGVSALAVVASMNDTNGCLRLVRTTDAGRIQWLNTVDKSPGKISPTKVVPLSRLHDRGHHGREG